MQNRITWHMIHDRENNVAGPLQRRQPVDGTLATSIVFDDAIQLLLDCQDAPLTLRTQDAAKRVANAVNRLAIAVAQDDFDGKLES